MSKVRTFDVRELRYTTPEVLTVTRLRPEVLQTWVNREVLGARNTGRGKRRLYSGLDVVKLAIMRRMADLQIALSTSLDIAEAASAELQKSGSIDWNLYIVLRPSAATDAMGVSVVSSGGPLSRYGPFQGDPYNVRLSTIVEWFEGAYRRRKKRSLAKIHASGAPDDKRGERPIIEDARDTLAREGIHAEPAIVFPLGEIVNGAILQLRALEDAEND